MARGPLIPAGEPVGFGGFGLDDPLLYGVRPLPAEADCPPPNRSDIDAFSSSKSGVNGFGFRNATSRVYWIADAVSLEILDGRERVRWRECCIGVDPSGVGELSSSGSRSCCSVRPTCGANLTRGGLIPAEVASI